jgi:acyl-CoA thioester hydrolase
MSALTTTLSLRVRTYDIDFATIVHNMVYIRWLEDLRTALLADILPIETILASGESPILTHTEIDYRRPIRLGDDVTGEMWVETLDRTRWTVVAEIRVGDRICATARQQGYFADLETLRPVRIPNRLREAWGDET